MRVYLIGAGVISRTHAAALSRFPENEGIELHVADPIAAVLEQFLTEYPNAVGYHDASEMLSQPAQEDDIVVVCTPPSTHFELSCLALNTGRNVLCEKPLAMNVEQARDMYALAQSKGRLFGCCSDRFAGASSIEQVKQLLASGVIGDVYKVTYIHRAQRSRPGIEYQPSSRWFLDKSKAAGGILMDWAPYDFAVLNDIFKPTKVEVTGAWTSRPTTHIDPVDAVFDVETHVGAMFRYALPDGHQIAVHYERASGTHGQAYDHVEIEGTLGAIRWTPYEYGEPQPVTLSLDKDGHVEEQRIEIEDVSKYPVMDRPLSYFIEAVKGQPSSLALLNEQAVFNFSCITAVEACANTNEPQVVVLNR